MTETSAVTPPANGAQEQTDNSKNRTVVATEKVHEAQKSDRPSKKKERKKDPSLLPRPQSQMLSILTQDINNLNRATPDTAAKTPRMIQASRSVDTLFFLVNQSNHSLLALADGKAKTLIAVNTSIVTLILAGFTVADRLGHAFHWEITPLLVLLIFDLFSILFIIFSLLERFRSPGKISLNSIREDQNTLLLFENASQLSDHEHLMALFEILEDSDRIYLHMIHLKRREEKILKKKFFLLRMAFISFLLGLLLSAGTSLVMFMTPDNSPLISDAHARNEQKMQLTMSRKTREPFASRAAPLSTTDGSELLPLAAYKITDIPNRSHDNKGRKWEVSGITQRENSLFVVFDNAFILARISLEPHTGMLTASEWLNLGIKGKDKGEGFEAISYHPASDRFYAIIESLKRKGKVWNAKVVPIQADKPTQGPWRAEWLDFPLEGGNKGIEGVKVVPGRDGSLRLFALCEGNLCRNGKKGREPGAGRILVFQEKENEWRNTAMIQLPEGVRFEDYSGIDIDTEDGTVAIVSQASSSLWVGRLNLDSLVWEDEVGRTYTFPQRDGKPLYCNIEGVLWADNGQHDTLYVVSDKAKKKQPKHCRNSDQSIQIFRLPT